ncbi:MAG: CDP-diacylglycerol--glycerol-3-phosphate 3-phosphatidyltransferase [Christensenellaceae bacterium]|jgi:CDP-diacylglycerol--glycerol-3-phosphate 3-phosphatidyltransferase|nr:CDP-diacylglycerol--glycerol-3-phosphate 3-phosphatidyltransferase [Christensenellaceae bacterium]
MNLPNKLSLSRILFIPIIVFMYLATFVPYGIFIALGLYIIAGITDLLDGHFARKLGLVTKLGSLLDTLADKLLITAALLLVVVDGTIPAPYGVIAAVIIIGREIVITALRQVAALQGISLSADKWGKIKAVFQDISVGAYMLLAGINMAGWLGGTTFLFAYEIFCHVLLGIAVLLTIYSGINYLVVNQHLFKEETKT